MRVCFIFVWSVIALQPSCRGKRLEQNSTPSAPTEYIAASNNSLAIVGGIDSDVSSVVAIYNAKHENVGKESICRYAAPSYYCSAVMVCPGALITAGHCDSYLSYPLLVTTDSKLRQKDSCGAFSAVPVTEAQMAGRVTVVADKNSLPFGDDKSAPYDTFLILKLADPIEGLSYPIVDSGEAWVAGDRGTVVGYGQRDRRSSSGGSRSEGKMIFLKYDERAGSSSKPSKAMILSDDKTYARRGDSGGGLFDSAGKLAGIFSAYVDGVGDNEGQNIYMPTGPHFDALRPILKKACEAPPVCTPPCMSKLDVKVYIGKPGCGGQNLFCSTPDCEEATFTSLHQFCKWKGVKGGTKITGYQWEGSGYSGSGEWGAGAAIKCPSYSWSNPFQ